MAMTADELTEQVRLRRLQLLTNPPMIIKKQCRFCGQPMLEELRLALHPGGINTAGVVMRLNGDGYAHQACYERENPC